MIASHNVFDFVESSNPIWTILHSPEFPDQTIRGTLSLSRYALVQVGS